MNIFVLHENPVIAARLMYDKHVTKMPLEASQMLAMPIRLQLGMPGWLIRTSTGQMTPYDLTLLEEQEDDQLIPLLSRRHLNHPCSKWTRESRENFNWLLSHAYELCNISSRRSGKESKVYTYLVRCEMWADSLQFPNRGLTPFANATGSVVSNGIVETYRGYYRTKKTHLASYSGKKMTIDEKLKVIMSSKSHL